MVKVGFMGLGIMGRPMATRLLKAGYPMVVFNRTPSKCRELVSRGAIQASTPKELGAESDMVITMLSDTPVVEGVLFGKDGLAFGLPPGRVVIDMSTLSPAATVEFSRRLGERGSEMLDAPVSGGEKGAREGTLSIMVGGKRPIFEKCLPIFQILGRTITYTGPSGNGQRTKLVNQVVGALNLLAVADGLRLAQRTGLDLATTLECIGGGAASSWMLANLGPKIISADFAPGFSIRLQQKDLRLAREMAAESGGQFPGMELVYQCFTAALEKGLGGQGNQGLVNLWSQAAKSD